MGTLAEWKSHKIIKAGKIKTINHPGTIDSLFFVLQVEDAEGRETEIKVHPNVFARGIPGPGDYFVVYDDEYQSWSPAAAFEKGYTRITT